LPVPGRQLYPRFFFAAVEVFQLGPVYEGIAALLLLRPYRRAALSYLRGLAQCTTPVETL
jgi:hypothetical protein